MLASRVCMCLCVWKQVEGVGWGGGTDDGLEGRTTKTDVLSAQMSGTRWEQCQPLRNESTALRL